MRQLQIKKANDMHVHLRQGDMLVNVLPHTVLQCARALVMPNTMPPVLTAEDVKSYRQSITDLLQSESGFTPLMTFKVAPSTSADEIALLKAQGAIAGKLYPEGVTTNSEGGVTDSRPFTRCIRPCRMKNWCFVCMAKCQVCFPLIGRLGFLKF